MLNWQLVGRRPIDTIPGLGIEGSMASVTIPASPVAWGLTITSNSRNRDQAIAFVERLLGRLVARR